MWNPNDRVCSPQQENVSPKIHLQSKLDRIRTKYKLRHEQIFNKMTKFNMHSRKLLQLLGDFGAYPTGGFVSAISAGPYIFIEYAQCAAHRNRQ